MLLAASTVAVAMLGLYACGITYVGLLGLAAVFGVLTAAAGAVTLVPALLGLAGRRIDRYKTRRTPVAETGSAGDGWHRYAAAIGRRPWLFLGAGLAILCVLAIPLLSMQTGHVGDGADPGGYTDKQAYDLITEGFGPGYNGPFTIVVDVGHGASADTSLASHLQSDLAATSGVAKATPLTPTPDGALLVGTVIPSTGPQDRATTTLYNTLVNTTLPDALQGTGDQGYVTGLQAAQTEFDQIVTGRLPVIIAVVIGVAVFLSFVTSTNVVIKQLSAGLAASILIDATIVRLLLVPSVMYLLGTASWWLPKWLGRLLPRIAVQGAPEPPPAAGPDHREARAHARSGRDVTACRLTPAGGSCRGCRTPGPAAVGRARVRVAAMLRSGTHCCRCRPGQAALEETLMEVTLDAADDRTPATNGKLAAAPLVTRRTRRVTAAEHPRPQLRGRSLWGTSSAEPPPAHRRGGGGVQRIVLHRRDQAERAGSAGQRRQPVRGDGPRHHADRHGAGDPGAVRVRGVHRLVAESAGKCGHSSSLRRRRRIPNGRNPSPNCARTARRSLAPVPAGYELLDLCFASRSPRHRQTARRPGAGRRCPRRLARGRSRPGWTGSAGQAGLTPCATHLRSGSPG